jgi:hypothetical protein
MTVPARSGATERPVPREWLTRYLRLQQRYDVKVDELLRDAAAEAERELAGLAGIGPSAVVRSATILQAVTAISQALSGVWMEMGDLVRAGQADARAVALKMAFDWDRVLLYSVIEPGRRAAMKSSLVEGARFNVEAALARVYMSRLPLAEQVYKTAEMTRGWVEHRVTTSIARGRTVDQLAKDVRAFINPATRGGASYAARRLARTEINNAYHAVIVVHNEDKPWVNGMRWNLSGSHPTVDICDTLARNDAHGMGRGVFPRTGVPRKPHPQCLCYITPRTMSNDQFVKAWRAGTFRDYVARTYET